MPRRVVNLSGNERPLFNVGLVAPCRHCGVRFLIDNALSPAVAEGLTLAGHDAKHVRDSNIQTADDITVLDLAAREGRVLIRQIPTSVRYCLCDKSPNLR